MAIDFGQMTERVRVEQPTEDRNRFGESVQSWATYSERWASIEELSSREFLSQGQQQTEITHRVRMRYVDGLTQNMRLIWRGRTLEVISLLEHNNRSEHELICSESV